MVLNGWRLWPSDSWEQRRGVDMHVRIVGVVDAGSCSGGQGGAGMLRVNMQCMIYDAHVYTAREQIISEYNDEEEKIRIKYIVTLMMGYS